MLAEVAEMMVDDADSLRDIIAEIDDYQAPDNTPDA